MMSGKQARPQVRRALILSVRSLQKLGEDRCPLMAAAISYYGLVSLFPLLIVIMSIFGVFLRDSSLQQDVVDKVLELMPLTPDKGKTEVKDAVEAVAGTSVHLSVLGLLLLSWSGMALFSAIRTSLNVVWKLETTRSLIKEKLAEMALMAAVGAFFLLSISITGLLHATQQASSDILGPLSSDATFLWRTIPHVAPATFSFGACLVLYRFVPHTRTRVADVWPGALVATLLFEVVKHGFSLYVANFGRYDLIYGSLGAVVALLFWIYLSAVILLLGAEVASEYPLVKSGEHDDYWGQSWLLGGARARLAELRQRVRLGLTDRRR
jgi:membrane protein